MSDPNQWQAIQWSLDDQVSADPYDPSLVDGVPVLADLLSGNGDLRQPRGKRCFNFDGVDDYIAVPGLVGTESISNDGPAVLTVSAGRIDCAAGGKAWNIQINGGAFAVYHCNEETGTDSFDSSGNGNHGTITNISAGFHATDDGVTSNPANQVGYSLTGGTAPPIIPRNEAIPAEDVLGNPLQFTGRGPLPIVVESPVASFDGIDDAIMVNHLSGLDFGTGDFAIAIVFLVRSWNATRMIAGKAEPSGSFAGWAIRSVSTNNSVRFSTYNSTGVDVEAPIVAGRYYYCVCQRSGGTQEIYIDGQLIDSEASPIDVTSSVDMIIGGALPGWSATGQVNIADYRVFSRALTAPEVANWPNADIVQYPIDEGAGDIVYNVVSNANHGTVMNRSAGFHGGRTNTVRDHCIEYGGRIGASSEFVPGLLDGSSAADGNAITLLAGHHGNPHSRLIYDHWSVPELGVINYPAESPPGELLRTVAPANTKFRSEQSPTELADGTSFPDGDNRLFTLPGSQWSQAIADYISRSAAPPAWLPAAAVKSTVLLGQGVAR